MLAIVVSDTHRNYTGLHGIVKNNDKADLFIHLGDGRLEVNDVMRDFPEKNFVFVKGNCDYYSPEAPRETIVNMNGVKVLCTHGDLYRVNAGTETLAEHAKAAGCQVVLYGHTHVYSTEHRDGIYLMNPGSITTPRGKNPPSYGVLEIEDGGRIKMDIIQTG